MSSKDTSRWERAGQAIGRLVASKQEQYGDSFGQSGHVLRVLYPDGVSPEHYDEMLAITRVIDKLFRVANGSQGDESPWRDIVGYGLLAVEYESSEAEAVRAFMRLEQSQADIEEQQAKTDTSAPAAGAGTPSRAAKDTCECGAPKVARSKRCRACHGRHLKGPRTEKPDPDYDDMTERQKKAGNYDWCACGAVKAKSSAMCRSCRTAHNAAKRERNAGEPVDTTEPTAQKKTDDDMSNPYQYDHCTCGRRKSRNANQCQGCYLHGTDSLVKEREWDICDCGRMKHSAATRCYHCITADASPVIAIQCPRCQAWMNAGTRPNVKNGKIYTCPNSDCGWRFHTAPVKGKKNPLPTFDSPDPGTVPERTAVMRQFLEQTPSRYRTRGDGRVGPELPKSYRYTAE